MAINEKNLIWGPEILYNQGNKTQGLAGNATLCFICCIGDKKDKIFKEIKNYAENSY